MYKISIIMPIFNVEKYIERSFKSILNQTMDLNDIEVIIVDDCSTDNTINIIKKYEKKYFNFKAVYLEKNSGGAAIPRNVGLKIASGKYLMFLDPDDEFAIDMCETLYKKIENSPFKIVKCNHKLISSNNTRVDYQFDENIPEVIIDCKTELPPNSSSICNAIHERAFIIEKNIIFPNSKVVEDVIFSINEFFNTDKILVLNNYAGYYYHTNDETSHSKIPSTKNMDSMLTAYEMTRDIIKKHDRVEIIQNFFSKRCVLFFIMLLKYDGNKKRYFTRFYEFEKSLNCTLEFELMWMNIVNKFIVKNHISTAIFIFEVFNFIRKSPLVNIYRRFL